MLKAFYRKHTLRFNFKAGTSRGVLHEKTCYILRLEDSQKPGVYGYGECAPLEKLSVDANLGELREEVLKICSDVESFTVPKHYEELYTLLDHIVSPQFPALRFALETALLDLMNGGKRQLYDNVFARGEQSLVINGLIWMGDREFMHRQIEEKLRQNFRCIKMKIGAIDFETEYELLRSIRERYSADQLVLRVDANGAFDPHEARHKLERLEQLGLHSIEQPIKAGQHHAMKTLCADTPLPIALDEELIGIHELEKKKQLLDDIQPQYIILKPTLLGGLRASEEWIRLAEERQIGWWMTSALESNLGLNAISQFTANFPVGDMPQGLGTGQLFENNISSPLEVIKDELHYQADQSWDFHSLDF